MGQKRPRSRPTMAKVSRAVIDSEHTERADILERPKLTMAVILNSCPETSMRSQGWNSKWKTSFGLRKA
jgi:hypothetical protein